MHMITSFASDLLYDILVLKSDHLNDDFFVE